MEFWSAPLGIAIINVTSDTLLFNGLARILLSKFLIEDKRIVTVHKNAKRYRHCGLEQLMAVIAS